MTPMVTLAARRSQRGRAWPASAFFDHDRLLLRAWPLSLRVQAGCSTCQGDVEVVEAAAARLCGRGSVT